MDSILLDVFLPDEKFAPSSANLLKLGYDEGAIVICDIVYAELVPQFFDKTELDNTLRTLNVSLSSIDSDIAFTAGEKWEIKTGFQLLIFF